jgi:serine/threonine-protein kinase
MTTMSSTDSTPQAGEATTMDPRDRVHPPTPNLAEDEAEGASHESLDVQFELAWLRRRLGLTSERLAVRVDPGGRFEIVDLLGRGGMGAVYLANDATAQRKVALKVVTAKRANNEGMQADLLKEARAMAQIGNHPNVVQIFDVLTAVSGETVVVIEHIDGETLRAWQSGKRHEEIVSAYLAAARGLAAAHGAGVVHRDFKADNVLVAGELPELRVAVGDFGLASGSLVTEVESLALRSGRSSKAGTLAYMAPDQYHGLATMQSDQYAFCVSLWEALTGERPFPEHRSPLDEVPNSHRRIPTWLHRVLRRGLSWHPHDRYPSMAALIAEIEAAPRRRRWRRAALAVGVTLGALAWIVDALRTDPCEVELARLDAVWNDTARAEIIDSFDRLDREPKSRDHAIARLDAAATAWREHTLATCTQETVAEREAACLSGWLERLREGVEALRNGDEFYFDQLPFVLEPLSGGGGCEIPTTLPNWGVAALLQSAELAEQKGQFQLALSEANEAIERAAALPPCVPNTDYSSEQAAALYRLGHVYGEIEDWPRARETLHDAAEHAIACNDPLLFDIRAHEALVTALGPRAHRRDAADLLADADAMLARLLPAHLVSLRRVEQQRVAAHVDDVAGELDVALTRFDTALRLLADIDPDALATAVRIHHNKATVLQNHGRNDAAMFEYQRARDRLAEAIGEQHPETLRADARIAVNQALIDLDAGRLDAAQRKLDAAFVHGDTMVLARAHAAQLEVSMVRLDALGPEPAALELERSLAELGRRARAAQAWRADRQLPDHVDSELLLKIGEALATSACGSGELVDVQTFDEGVLLLRTALGQLDDAVERGQVRYTLAALLSLAGRLDEARALLVELRGDADAMRNAELAAGVAQLDTDLAPASEAED